MNKFTGLVRRCIEDYDMIADGETIAVGVSGGKDSLVVLCALASLRRFYPKRFDIHAITIDTGFPGGDFSPIANLCRELGVPYTVKKTEISSIVFDQRREKNPCALCSKMRRGSIAGLITELGIKKIALGHHYDDAVETFALSLLYEGRIHCFRPVTYMDRTGITQLRPMLYAREDAVRALAKEMNLPILHNPCPQNGVSKREEVKVLLKTLGETYPDIKPKIFGAIQRLPIEGWETV